MNISEHVEALRTALASAASVGDDHSREVAENLTSAVAPALQLQALLMAAALAENVNEHTNSVHVDVVVTPEGTNLRVTPLEPEYVAADPDFEIPSMGENEESIRITLRIPESVKVQVDALAQRTGKSLNAWIVAAIKRVVAQDLTMPSGPHRGNSRTSGVSGSLRGWVS